MRVHPAITALVLLSALPASASAPGWNVGFRLQMDFGGDKLVEVPYSDGSTSDLKAGTYATLALEGALVPLRSDAHSLELVGTAGFSTWSTGPANTDDRLLLRRFPLELLAGYRFDVPSSALAFGLRGGLQYQLIGDLSGSGALENVSIPVDNALGWLGELRVLYKSLALNVRYTRQSYYFPAAALSKDASSVGLGISFVIPEVGGRPAAATPAGPRL